MDFTVYGTSTRFSNFTAVLVSVIVNVIMWVIAGAIVGWVMGRGKKEA